MGVLAEYLTAGAAKMGLELNDGVFEGIAKYHDMLCRANEKFNLTRIPSDARESAFRNYLDSLAPLAVPGLLDGAMSIIDAGAGAGLPGIPLALAMRDSRVTMIDSVDKKIRFIRQAIRELSIDAAAVHARLEDAGRKTLYREKFDACVCRALAPMCVLAELTLPFVRVGGVLIAYKGPSAMDELDRAAEAIRLLGGKLERVVKAPSPGDEWEHRLVVVRKVAGTSPEYPRKPGIPAKKPL